MSQDCLDLYCTYNQSMIHILTVSDVVNLQLIELHKGVRIDPCR